MAIYGDGKHNENMEGTFQEKKEESIELLLKMREMSTLMDIFNEVKERNLCLNCFGTEYDYMQSKGAHQAFGEIEMLIQNKIKKLKENEQ